MSGAADTGGDGMSVWPVVLFLLLSYPALVGGRYLLIVLLRIVGVVLLSALMVVAICAVALGDQRGQYWGVK